jgi:hypothetical protein
MADLTEESLMELLSAIRAPMHLKPSQLIVTEEGIERMRGLCDDDPEFRKRVLAEFPQMEGIV